MSETCLITGGAGFIGSHLVRYLLRETDWKIVVLDKMTYAAEEGRRLDPVKCGRLIICPFPISPLSTWEWIPAPHYIVHLAAETHVEYSIAYPEPFIESNVFGTYEILRYAQNLAGFKKFLYFSTDEVFGEGLDEGEPHHEWARYNCSSPYSASKAAGEELTLAWARTYGVPAVISHCCNVIGPDQHLEKFLPKLIDKIRRKEKVILHVDRNNIPGWRMYIHVEDVCRAIHLLLLKGAVREKYNIPGVPVNNLDMAQHVADILDETLYYELRYPEERPGWDFSYCIEGTKLQDLGWGQAPGFMAQLEQVVKNAVP